jgi:Tfp pilus assembly protein PilZ
VSVPSHLRLAAFAHAFAILWIYPLSRALDGGLIGPTLVVLCAPPFVAFGLLTRKRVAWILLVTEVALLLAVLAATLAFSRSLEVAWAIMPPMLHVALSGAVFLTRTARAPYLFDDGRGFRTTKRHQINLRTVVEIAGVRREAQTLDLSRAGAYATLPIDGLSLQQRVVFELHLRSGRALRLPAHVMSLHPKESEARSEGIGVRFAHLTPHDKRSLDVFIEEGRRHLRQPVRVRAAFDIKGETYRCETHDLSLSGCYLEAQPQLLQPGDPVALTLDLHDEDKLDVIGKVSWLPESERLGKPDGIAIEFHSLSKRDHERLMERLAEAGITDSD